MNHPEKGFYYHYKHDPNGSFENYSYEVVGVGRHTEEHDSYFVAYRPLYKNDYFNNFEYSLRPLEMFMETIEKDGKIIPRFQKIHDPELITKLEQLKKEFYGS